MTALTQISTYELSEARAFLASLQSADLRAMLAPLLPGIHAGEAGSTTWLAAALIRSELRRRGGGE